MPLGGIVIDSIHMHTHETGMATNPKISETSI